MDGVAAPFSPGRETFAKPRVRRHAARNENRLDALGFRGGERPPNQIVDNGFLEACDEIQRGGRAEVRQLLEGEGAGRFAARAPGGCFVRKRRAAHAVEHSRLETGKAEVEGVAL